MPIFYFFFYKVGKVVVLGRVPQLDMQQLAFSELLQKGWDLVTVMMVGGLIVGIPAAILTYFVALRCIWRIRKSGNSGGSANLWNSSERKGQTQKKPRAEFFAGR